jgi:MYXO-CTERM domain-containing protein
MTRSAITRASFVGRAPSSGPRGRDVQLDGVGWRSIHEPCNMKRGVSGPGPGWQGHYPTHEVSMSALRRFACAAAVASLLASPGAHATVSLLNGFGGTVGYGTQCLSKNDDGSSAPFDITSAFPGGLHFFANTHTTAYVNTNGNITFSGSVSQYTPNAFPVANRPMIAAYWGDVDIRYYSGTCTGSAGVTCNPCTPCHNPTENGVWWYLEPGRLVATWDRVGYYSCHNDKRMSFQIVLTSVQCGAPGDFDVEFRYNRCEWETGDASGGSSGFGGTEAQAGFDAGDNVNFVSIPGSMNAGIAAALCNGSNVGTPGLWRFQIRSGTVICPDSGAPCNTGNLGVCASGRTNCVGSGTECLQDVQSSAEVCDGLDNDCDGLIDEDTDGPLCPTGQVCDRGLCVPKCIQATCHPGESCTANGVCVETACVNVTCPTGQRCVGGVCVGACDGVVCPPGQACRAGRCIDLCQGMTCDSCTVCVGGVCQSRCQYTPCPSGQTCQADGRCVANACASVTCPSGTHCVSGACIDDCTGVVCPTGQYCTGGQCVLIPPQTDAGQDDAAPQVDAPVQDDAAPQVDAPVVEPDAGPQADAGVGHDAAANDAPVQDGGGAVESDAAAGTDGAGPGGGGVHIGTPGCNCRVAQSGDAGSVGLLVLVLAALLLPARRRR